jgi:hypothetical protein
MNSSCNRQTHTLADVFGVTRKQPGLNEEAIWRNEIVIIKQMQMWSVVSSSPPSSASANYISYQILNPEGTSLISGQSICCISWTSDNLTTLWEVRLFLVSLHSSNSPQIYFIRGWNNGSKYDLNPEGSSLIPLREWIVRHKPGRSFVQQCVAFSWSFC